MLYGGATFYNHSVWRYHLLQLECMEIPPFTIQFKYMGIPSFTVTVCELQYHTVECIGIPLVILQCIGTPSFISRPMTSAGRKCEVPGKKMVVLLSGTSSG